MILHDKRRYSGRWRQLGASLYRQVRGRRTLLGFLLVAGLAIYTVASIGVGVALHKTGAVGGVIVPIWRTRLAVIPNYLSGHLLGRPEELEIDIKHVNYQRLAYKREQALRQGFLIASGEDYVPAQIRYRGQTIPVELRLKGDMIDHLRWRKWSFRVKVKGNHTLFGMKVFSLQHPKTRNYLYEWLYHQALKRAGLIALRYDFVKVNINGEPMGIYALEEHFSKELIEGNRYREAPIVRFNEDLYWAQSLHLVDFPGYLAAKGAGHFLASAVEPFRTSRTMRDPTLRKEFEYAAELLESFRRGEIATHELFDVEKLANYIAIIEVMGTSEWTLDWTDQRFYFNPITAKLEPIGFDGHVGYPNHELIGYAEFTSLGDSGSEAITELPTRLFRDPVFFRAYVRALERVSEPQYLDTLLEDVKPELKAKLRILHREYPYFTFSTDVFYQNQAFIRKMLDPVKGMHAYYERVEDTPQGKLLVLKMGNIQGLPLEVLDATYQGHATLPLADGETILPARAEEQPVNYTEVRFRLPAGLTWNDALIEQIRVRYSVLGASRSKEVAVYPWSYPDPQFVREDQLHRPPALAGYPFLSIQGKHLFVRPGTWRLDQPLIVPEGYVFHIGEGTMLDLTAGAMIVSRSPVEWIGSEGAPVVITSTDGTGGGVVVVQADGPSVLNHVRFENLNAPRYRGWQLTGAVTFYESPMQIAHTEFFNLHSEDALNAVRSEFQVVDSLFQGTASDAFDVDFGTGRVERTRFVQCNNDALDFSGSFVQVRDVWVDGAGDKGISAGEASRIEVFQTTLWNVRIGLASKDQSQLIAEHVRIRGAEVGLTAFQKKPEFGPATIEATDVDIQNAQDAYLVEIHSQASLNGRRIRGRQENLAVRFYGPTAQSNQNLQAISPVGSAG